MTLKAIDFNYSRQEWEEKIRQWVFDEEARTMLELWLLDGLTYNQIADRLYVSTEKVAKIVRKSKNYLFKHLDKS